MPKQGPAAYMLIAVSLICYVILAYEIQRYDTLLLFIGYAILFAIYLWVIKNSSDQTVVFWIIVSLLFRASFLLATPQLSDDFYRFIWDGRLWAAGYHPFGALPSEYLNLNIQGVDAELYQHLNSKDYFAIYPPIAQYVFWVAVKISPDSVFGSVVVMRVAILLAEIGSLLIMRILSIKFNLPTKNVLFYALNPLIIMELTGNLHLEAFVIFFLLLAVFLINQQRILLSASSVAIAICAKLIPIIFLPSFIGRLAVKRLLFFYSIVIFICLLIFIPFLNLQVINSLKSVGLYFNKFEFNASLYYLVREMGYTLYGYNIIQTVGWKLALITFLLIMTFVWIRNRQSREKQEESLQTLFLDWMWMLSIYLLFTTTLHPWYITTLLALSVFTPYRFVVVWTAFIFLTYAGYTSESFHEVLWLTALEYVVVASYLGYELWKRRSTLYFL